MAITVDWDSKIINVPKADTTLVQSSPSEIRRLDLDVFRLTLKDLEDDAEGMPFLDTHQHNTTVTVSGVTLARVIEIINGYTVTFEDGQYAVELIGANSNVGDVTNVNQVSIRTANSAGLVDSPSIKLQSYTLAKVYIDTIIGTSGNLFPKGTPPDPVDNFGDAEIIAMRNNFSSYHIRGICPMGASDDIPDTEWTGVSPISSVLVMAGGDTSGATFELLGLLGAFNGRASFRTCAIGGPTGVTGISGIFSDCGFNGNVTLDATNTDNVLFKDCASVITGGDKPIFDINGSTGDVHFRNWVGELKITNFSGGNDMSIDCAIGTIELDSTCTAGTIRIRMNAAKASLTDNSGVGCTVIIEETVLEPVLAII